MKKTIRISAVSYLNTKPFLYGIYKEGVDKFIDLSLDIPSSCAKKLIDDEVDIGLIPVASIPLLKSPYIISDYCIGTKGAVKTVGIYSNCPIKHVTELLLDYQSKTSVELSRYLMQNYWEINPEFINTSVGFENKIKGTTAGLMIGDRTIGLDQRFPFFYDLGEIWNAHTGLPFVFALWVSNKKLSDAFLSKFNSALKSGVNNLDQVAGLFQSCYPNFSIKEYYSKNIDYHMTEKKQQAMHLFLNYIGSKKLLFESIK